MKFCTLATLLLGVLALNACVHEDNQPDVDANVSIAIFEGREIDLSQDWGDARHCIILGGGAQPECFRTDAEASARVAQIEGARIPVTGGISTVQPCGLSLNLYDFWWYGGRTLRVNERQHWRNLSDYGFNNQVSSYATSSCGVYFADYANGNGERYHTGNWTGVPQLHSWNNRISSFYIP